MGYRKCTYIEKSDSIYLNRLALVGKFVLLLCMILFHNRSDCLAEENSRFIAKVAVVDTESILQNSNAMQQIKASVEQLNKNMQHNLIEKEIELKRLEEELLHSKDNMTEEEFSEKQQDFSDKVAYIQSQVHKQKTYLEKLHSQAVSQVYNLIIDIIGALAKKHDFNLVLPSTQILFVGKEMNITMEVVAELNHRLPYIVINENE